MLRRILGALLFVSLIGSPNGASAYWTGYWTYHYTPPPPEWVWTWVWYVGSTISPSVSASLSPAGTPTGLATESPDFYGIVIDDFWSLQPEDVKLSGLFLTEFSVEGGNGEAGNDSVGRGDLILRYIGAEPLVVGENLGSVTLFNPDATPLAAPPVTLGYTETFETTSGLVHDTGTISSAVPEPSTWAMLLIGFSGLGFGGYRKTRRRAHGPVQRMTAAKRTSAAHGLSEGQWLDVHFECVKDGLLRRCASRNDAAEPLGICS